MFEVVLKVAPIVLLFLLGIALRQAGVMERADGDRLLRVVVYVALPALILLSIGRVELDPSLALLPLSASLTILATYPAARALGHRFELPRGTMGVFMVGPMIMNMAVLFPFVLAVWGQEGIARLALFDLGNAVLVLTLVYGIACQHGDGGRNLESTLKRLASFPPLWALLIALMLNLTGLNAYPGPLADFLELAGDLLVPLLMLTLGVYFDPRLVRPGPLLAGTVLRAGLGLGLGLVWVTLFDLQGLSRAVVLLGTMAPVGFNTLVFANQENLDREFASSLASVSLLLAMIYIPGALYWLT